MAKVFPQQQGREDARRSTWLGVCAPILALVAVIIGLAVATFANFAREQDRAFVESTQRLVASALAGRAASLESMTVEVANWDVAYANVTARWNAEWVRAMLYSSVEDVILVFRAGGAIRHAWVDPRHAASAERLSGAAARAGAAIPNLRRLARAATPMQTAATTYATDNGRLLIVSVAPFTREAQELRLAPQRASYDYHATVDVVSDAELARMGEALGLSGLSFVAPGQTDGGDFVRLPLRAADGDVVGALQWAHARPGFAGFRQQIGWVVFALLSIGVLTALIARHLVARQVRAVATARAARKSAQEKSEFLARVGGELRTPLNAIIGYGELIQEESTSGATHEDAQHIIDAARRLERMLDDIMDQSGLDAGALRLHPEMLPVAGLLAEMQGFMQPVAHWSGVEIVVTHEASAVYAYADHTRLRQCLINLVGNAVKFSPRGARVRVHARPSAERDAVLFEIRDAGADIDAAALRTIFRPFGQAHAAIAAVYGGVGLGLSIARSLARAMGGDITVSSKPGEGSTFTLRIPAAARSFATV